MLREPFRLGDGDKDQSGPRRLKDLIGWDIVLSAEYVQSALKEFANSPEWSAALPDLIDDLKLTLRDTMDLMRELGEADDRNSRSHWDLPSISPHWQNRDFHDWVVNIELLRDSWLAVWRTSQERARRIVEDWQSQPYPVFKRLAFYGATHNGIAPDGQWVDWLLADDAWWLWSSEAQRETMRLLVLRGALLPNKKRARLEQTILAGPPRSMFREDIEPEHWNDLVDHTVWLNLAKLMSGGTTLDSDAKSRFDSIASAHPEWQLEDDERDEFSHWMTSTGDPGFLSRRELERVPRQHRELVDWLQRTPKSDPFSQNDWSDLCREQFAVAARALYTLARRGLWPEERWRDALQVWSEKEFLQKSWWHGARVLLRSPSTTFDAIVQSVSWWLQAASKVFEGQEERFLDLCKRVITTSRDGALKDGDVIDVAINHPVGHATQALLNRWFRSELRDEEGLPDELRQIFTTLCDTRVEQYRHGRVLLAANVIALFRVDNAWATKHLLPLFSWQRFPADASVAWEGFLWSPRLYRPLVSAFKVDFLQTAKHYDELGKHARQYSEVLTYVALEPGDTFKFSELRLATQQLPQKGLNETARALVRALNGSGEQREAYWANRISPYWKEVWPKTRALASIEIAVQLSLLAIAAGDSFPTALKTVRDWLQPLDHPIHVVQVLLGSGLCVRYPRDALSLLDRIIAKPQWVPSELGACLDLIQQSWTGAANDPKFRALQEYFQRRGTG